MPALTVRTISKTYGTTKVLEDISLDVESGEFVALLGASGSGKSTLLRIIAGLETCDTGSVFIGGRDATHLAPSARDIAMVFQNYALYPHKSVEENISLPLEMRRLSSWQRLPGMTHLSRSVREARAQIAVDAKAAAALTGIDHLMERRPSQLSGGQRQRVALARAMVRRPQLLLMDEPLSNLDAKLRVKLRTRISELHERTGATVVYVTHDQAEAMTMADRIAVMWDGRIIQIGPPQELYNNPSDVRVAESLGNPGINILTGDASPAGIMAGGLRWPVRHLNGPVKIGFRPECVKLEPAVPNQPSAGVVRAEHHGAEIHLFLDLPDGQRIIVRQDADCPYQPGHRVQLNVSRLLIFGEDGLRVAAERFAGDNVA